MEFPLNVDGITDAMQTLRDGKMRYRGVLKPQQ
jgi:D-arabinose 1-dehydrogenase-like Zn-dependent alcohol dehydrogenase